MAKGKPSKYPSLEARFEAQLKQKCESQKRYRAKHPEQVEKNRVRSRKYMQNKRKDK
jgi:hypothetical protein